MEHRDWASGRCTIGTMVVDIQSSFVPGMRRFLTICMPKHTTGARCQCTTPIRWTSSTQIFPTVLNHLLSPTLPNPLLILFPLPLNIPETPPPLSLPTNPAIQPQKRIRITLTQNLLALFCVVALAVSSFPRNLARPLRVLYWLQRRKRYDDAEGEDEDGGEEFERDVEGEGRGCEGCGVFVGRVDAGGG